MSGVIFSCHLFSKRKTVRVGWTKSDQLILFAYRRCNYEYKWGTTLSATSLQKKKEKEGWGSNFCHSDLSILFPLYPLLQFSCPKFSFPSSLLCKATVSLRIQGRACISGTSVLNLCLVPPWVYALPDCSVCARGDTWNCKGTWRERERQRNQLP